MDESSLKKAREIDRERMVHTQIEEIRQHVFNSFFLCMFLFFLLLFVVFSSNDFVIVGLSSCSSSSPSPSFILDSSFCLSHQSKDILLLL